MGIVFGKFVPTSEYESIRKDIRLASDAVGGTSNDPVDETKMQKYQTAIQKLKIVIKDAKHRVLPTAGVGLQDWEEEGGQGELYVEAILADRTSYPGAL
ncbi:MAG: hypothetical protein HUU29_14340 [Planctomycetaceae bacterium]|nr:hypothetical protein [Planctomycetaceae bacterium]